MRPIDADSVVERVQKWAEGTDDYTYGIARTVLQRVHSEPTLNGGEACKHCKHYEKNVIPCRLCVRNPANHDMWEEKK